MVSSWLRFLKSKKFMFLLSVLMLLGLALFLAGPKTMNKDFTKLSRYVFTLEPRGNKTIDVPLLLEQAYYMALAHNLVLRDVVLVEINGSRPFTLYQLKDNTAVKLAEHALFYSLSLSDVGIKDRLVVENEADATTNVRINIERVLTVKTADFTIPHVGFIIFIATLLALQFLSVAANGDTLIGSILDGIAFKLRRKNIDTRKTFLEAIATSGFILETLVPMLLCIVVYALTVYERMVYGQGLSLSEDVASHVLDCRERLALIGTLLCYFFTVIHRVFYILHRSVKVWILERKGQEFLKIHEEASKLLKGEKTIFPLALIILVVAVIMCAYGLEPKISLGIIICVSPTLLLAIACHVKIKQLQTSLGRDSFNENLIDFMEIEAKTMSLSVLGLFVILPAFTMMMPLFSALTSNMLLLEFYPSFIYRLCQSLVSWVDDLFTLLGQLQAPLCIILTGPYWITRVMICRFKAKYKSKLLADIAIFFAVFAISEYLKWTYSFFTQNQPYDMTSLPISILIGMTASILSDLLTEIRPK